LDQDLENDLSGQQVRWLDKISSFNKVMYVPGRERVLTDALSCIYSNDSPGTERARSECASLAVDKDMSAVCGHSEERFITMLTGLEARVLMLRRPARSESSRDSAEWIKTRFVLRNPGERKEGGSTAVSSEGSIAEPENSPIASNELESVVVTSDNALNIVPSLDQSPADVPSLIDLVTRVHKLKDKYNVEIVNGLVYLKEQGRRVLCIPKVVIQAEAPEKLLTRRLTQFRPTLKPATTLVIISGGMIRSQTQNHSVRHAGPVSIVSRTIKNCTDY
jgi:hypothetical protein